MKNEIYKTRLRAGKRTYFLDVRPTVNGKLFLEVTESKKKNEGEFERHSIMVFPEDYKSVLDELNRIYYKFFDEIKTEENTDNP